MTNSLLARCLPLRSAWIRLYGGIAARSTRNILLRFMDSYSSFFMFCFSLRFIPCMNRSAHTIQSQTNPIHSYFLVAFSGNKHQINTKRDTEQKQSPEKVSNQATFRGLPLGCVDKKDTCSRSSYTTKTIGNSLRIADRRSGARNGTWKRRNAFCIF